MPVPLKNRSDKERKEKKKQNKGGERLRKGTKEEMKHQGLSKDISLI